MTLPAQADLEHEAALKNAETYSHAASDVWRRLVYEPVHGGLEFTNMGGRAILDFVARHARLGPGSHALELCSGTGACARYLADRFGCSVTGVEMNDGMAAHARALADERVGVVHADVLEWRPPRSYDAVYAVDSLMLIPDLDGALARARQALDPGGALVLAEMTAGPRTTPALRAYAWDQDGIIHLLAPGEWTARLHEAGFGGVRVHDAADLAVRCWERILAAAERGAAAGDGNERRVCAAWAGLAALYRDQFREGGFGYARISARAI